MPRDELGRGLVITAALVIITGGIKLASDVTVPIVLSLFLAFVSAPVVFRLRRRGVPHAVGATLVLVGQLGTLLVVGWLLRTSLRELEPRLPFYTERLTAMSGELLAWLGSHGVQPRDEEAGAVLSLSQVLLGFSSALSELSALFGSGFLVFLTSAFVLFDAGRLWRRIDARFAEHRGDSLLNEISHEVNRYLAIKTLTSLMTGLLAFAACWALGVDFPVLWGLLAFLLNYIPVIGSIIAAIPPVLIALLSLGVWPAIAVSGAYFAINGVVGNILEPRIMGATLGISAATVMISVVVGDYVLGPVGAFLSVPLAMILRMALSSRPDTAWLAELIGGDDPEAEAPPPEPTGRLSIGVAGSLPPPPQKPTGEAAESSE